MDWGTKNGWLGMGALMVVILVICGLTGNLHSTPDTSNLTPNQVQYNQCLADSNAATINNNTPGATYVDPPTGC